MPENTSISQKLKELRQERGISVRELSERSGLSQPYIWQIESERRKNPSASKLKQLAEALGVGIEDFLGQPADLSDVDLNDLPKSLQQFVDKRGTALKLRKEDVTMLRHISYRGRRPEKVEDWELIFSFLKRILEP